MAKNKNVREFKLGCLELDLKAGMQIKIKPALPGMKEDLVTLTSFDMPCGLDTGMLYYKTAKGKVGSCAICTVEKNMREGIWQMF